jgi:hypothetical protein
MFILVRVCICVLGFYKLKALGQLMAPLSFSLHIVAKLLYSSPHRYDATVELHAMSEICSLTFSLKVDFICSKGLFKS